MCKITSKMTVATLFVVGVALVASQTYAATYSSSLGDSGGYFYYYINLASTTPGQTMNLHFFCPGLVLGPSLYPTSSSVFSNAGGYYTLDTFQSNGGGFVYYMDLFVGTTTRTMNCGPTLDFSDIQTAIVNLLLPTPGELLPEPTFWVLGWEMPRGIVGAIGVIFSTDSSTIPTNAVGTGISVDGAYDESVDFNSTIDPLPVKIFHEWTIRPMTLSTSSATTWYAQPIVVNGSGTVVANGGISSFSIDWNAAIPSSTWSGMAGPYYLDFGGSGYGAAAAPCSSATGGFTTDPIGNIKDALCSVFVMSPAQTADIGDNLTTLQSKVAKKPPFGYFASFSDQIALIQQTSTTSTELLGASTTAIIGEQFGSLDSGIAVLLWLLLATWGFHRASKIEL
jgi:hypothetical protein